METRLPLTIQPQPDDTTCGPTCLQAIYAYYGDPVPLEQVIAEVPKLDGGGTLEVLLGLHALGRGYQATIFSYNLHVFDPTWFTASGRARPGIEERLARQNEVKTDPKLLLTAGHYIEFLDRGGKIRFQDLTLEIMKGFLRRSIPILCGLSATYLYRSAREHGPNSDFDDIRGEPTGHFVVVRGYSQSERKALVADPLLPNPMAQSPMYEVSLSHLNCAIMLGIVTFDASLLIISPSASDASSSSMPATRAMGASRAS
jgi:hypothetical protein